MHERRAFGLIIHLEGGVRHDLPNHMLKQPILFLDPHFVLPNDFSLQWQGPFLREAFDDILFP